MSLEAAAGQTMQQSASPERAAIQKRLTRISAVPTYRDVLLNNHKNGNENKTSEKENWTEKETSRVGEDKSEKEYVEKTAL